MSIFENSIPIVKNPPLSFRIVKWLQSRNVRGSWRLGDLFSKRNLWNKYVRYTINEHSSVDIPIAIRPYTLSYIKNYEKDSIEFVKRILPQYNSNFTLVDCGADIGLMAISLISNCLMINQLVAFEPNKNSYNHLLHNTRLLKIKSIAKNMAVSDFSGNAELKHPSFDSHDHAAFIVPAEDGDIEVASIDSLNVDLGDNIFFKIDVEGAELSVIKGAIESLSKAKNFVILFESHYRQVNRTNIDPTSIISEIIAIKPCKYSIVEMPDAQIDLNKPFYEQHPKKIFNICVYSPS